MASRTAEVILSGRVDNTFTQLGAAVTQLGTDVDQISQRLLNFGKDSLEVYKNYEYNMKQLEAIWGSNGTFQKGSVEFREALAGMGEMAAEWAANTIFHTSDISNAFVIAAHAGWDYEKMLAGMPYVMRMAQAGDMDLSTSLDYVLKSMLALGIEYEQLPKWIDEWVYASNRSAGTAKEFGDTFLKMGSTGRFAKNREELLALTALMADMGTTGSAAGTLIRTSLLRILAPSGIAGAVMEELGATEEEIDSIRQNAAMLEAMDFLHANGFNAYDETGQAKSALEIYSELGEVLADISGGYENISKNETALGVLNTIFGTRGITGALNIIESLEKAKQLYEELEGGAAEGTGEYVQDVMMQSLFGQVTLLDSKIEELKRKVGEGLAAEWGNVQNVVGEIVTKITEMDDTEFGAILDGLTALAMAGPGLLIAGGALTFIGKLLSPVGLIGIGAVALASVAASLNSIKEAQFEGNWGNLELDSGELNKYIESLGEPFDKAFARVQKFNEELQASVDKYKELTGHFSSDLLTALLTKKDFTPEDRKKFEQYGIDIYEIVLGSITAAGDKAAEFWNAIYGGDGVSAADPQYQNIINMLQKGSEANIAQAQGIAEKIRAALMSGFENGFTDDDYQTILGYFEEYNELVARAQAQAASEEAFVQQEVMLHKAQTASYDEIKELAKTAAEQRDKDLEELERNFQTERARLKYYAIQAGMTPDEAEEYVTSMGVDEQYESWKSKYEAGYDEFLATLWDSQTKQSGLRDAYESLGKYADMFLNGQLDTDNILALMAQELGNSRFNTGNTSDSTTNDRAKLAKLMGNMIMSMGGEEAVAQRIQYYTETGNTDMAEKMKRLLAMEQLVNEFASVEMTDHPIWDFFGMTPDFRTSAQDSGEDYGIYKRETYERNRAMMEAMVGGTGYTLDVAKEVIDSYGLGDVFTFFGKIARGENTGENMPELSKESQLQLEMMRQMMAMTYDLPKIYEEMVKDGMPENPFNSEYLAMWGLLFDDFSTEYSAKKARKKIEQTEFSTGEIDGLKGIFDGIGLMAMKGDFSNWGDLRMPTAVLDEVYTPLVKSMKETYDLQRAYQDMVKNGMPEAPETYQNISAIWALLYGDLAENSEFYRRDKKPDSEEKGIENYDTPETKGGMTIDPEEFKKQVIAAIEAAQAEAEKSPVKVGTEETGAAEAAQAAYDILQAYADSHPVKFPTKTETTTGEGEGGEGAALPGMAIGGRATEPVVFGEAGPEWFIPEAKTGRTADLLLAAARASGFTLAELAMRSGASTFANGGTTGLKWSGLSSGSGGNAGGSGSGSGSSIKVQYSPVIHTDNAHGVDRALKEDKKRLEKWIDEWWDRRKLYDSMVAYN